MKVLIADDDSTTRRMLRAVLVRTGHQVIEAEDGRDAWEKLCASQAARPEDPVQFVISDWMMPGMDGPSLIMRIREANFRRYTYIVMLTVRSAVEDTIVGLEAGADDYLTKPFDPNELRARLAIGERILSLEAQLRDANSKLEEIATHDSLTGLLNRRALYEGANRELARAQRDEQPLSVIMIDLDHFKQINDRYGHLAGDHVLRQVGGVLAKGLREYDLLGRWGGEEFLMVLPATDMPESIAVAERLRDDVIRSPMLLPDGREITCQASFGVTTLRWRDPEMRFDTLVHHADCALYEAKRRGRNRVWSLPPESLAALSGTIQ